MPRLPISVIITSLLMSAPVTAEDTTPAGAPVLSLPIACSVGSPDTAECWVQALMDHDTGPGIADFRCGGRAKNDKNRFGLAHQGVDIGVLDWAANDQHLSVLAAAPGRVIGLRDGEIDTPIFQVQANAKSQAKACGNGVVIAHGNGWRTQYCHLQQDSVAVKDGQQVERGTPIGIAGTSGLASHPHLHFVLLHHNGDTLVPYDPFDGTSINEGCETARQSLWDSAAQQALQYRAVEIIKAGFTNQTVTGKTLLNTLRPDAHLALSPEQRMIAFAYFAGAQKGSVVELTVRDEAGNIQFSGKRRQQHNRARQWAAVTLGKNSDFTAQSGQYSLSIRIYDQQGTLIAKDTRHTVVSVTP